MYGILVRFGLMFDKGQKQSSTLSCDSSYCWLGPELGPLGSYWCFSFAPEFVGYSAPRDLHRRAAYSICESWFLIHQDVYRDLFVCS